MNKQEFEALPISEQRVLLAKDVLDQLVAQSLIEKHRVYFDPKFTSVWADTSAKEVLESEPCDVCAKGALVAAWVKRFNSYSVREIYQQDGNLQEVIDIFGHNMWSKIEHVFESWDIYIEGVGIISEKNDASLLRAYYFTQSIEEIMRNIIENNGQFKFTYFVFERSGLESKWEERSILF